MNIDIPRFKEKMLINILIYLKMDDKFPLWYIF